MVVGLCEVRSQGTAEIRNEQHKMFHLPPERGGNHIGLVERLKEKPMERDQWVHDDDKERKEKRKKETRTCYNTDIQYTYP